MNISEIAKKLGKVLNGVIVFFEENTYEKTEYMPYIIDEGKKEIVTTACLAEDGSTITIELKNGNAIGVGLTMECFNDEDDVTEDILENECRDMRIYELLAEMYNYQGLENELGDFEMDFLGIQ